MDKQKVVKTYVTDKFFGKGHWFTKLWQTLVAILLWLGVAIPIYWTISSTLLINNTHFLHAWRYQEGRTLFYFFDRFFIIAFIIIALVVVISTLHNNHRVKQHVEKDVQYDPERLAERKLKMENLYAERFGMAAMRTNIRHYTVTPEQNLTVNEIHDLYKTEDA